jgi:hypothetical protein
VKTAEVGKKPNHKAPLPLGLDSRNSSSTVTDVTGMSEVDYFKMQVRKMASAKKAAAAEDDEEEVVSPTRNFPSRTVAASSTPIKPSLTAGTKSPTNAKGKKKGKKKATKVVASKQLEIDEAKPRKPSPTPKERETVNRIEKLAIIDLDVQREFDSMRKNVMEWSRMK